MRTEKDLRSALQGFGQDSSHSPAQVLSAAKKRQRTRRLAAVSGIVTAGIVTAGLVSMVPQLGGREPSIPAAPSTVTSSPTPAVTRSASALAPSERYRLGREKGYIEKLRIAQLTDAAVPDLPGLKEQHGLTLTRSADEKVQPLPVDLDPDAGQKVQRLTVDGVQVRVLLADNGGEDPSDNQAVWVRDGDAYGLYGERTYWGGKIYGPTAEEFMDLVKALIRSEVPHQG